MVKYELMLLVWAKEHSETQAKKVIAKVKSIIEKNWWNVYFEDFWGLRRIAYKIKKNEEWYYAVFNFKYSPLAVKELENVLNINNDVIRYLIISIENDYKPFTFSELKAAEKVRYEKRKSSPIEKKSENAQSPSFNDRKHAKKPVKDESKPKEKVVLSDLDKKLNEIVEWI